MEDQNTCSFQLARSVPKSSIEACLLVDLSEPKFKECGSYPRNVENREMTVTMDLKVIN